MADTPQDSSSPEGPSELLSQARQLVSELVTFRSQADAQLKQIEVTRKTADSEALLAFNAKKACEEHATTIAGLKGTVEADTNAIATNKLRSDEALAALTTAKASVDSDVKGIDARRQEVDQASSEVREATAAVLKAAETGTTRLGAINELKDLAENVSAEANESAKAAANSATNASSAESSAAQSQAEAVEAAAEISKRHQESDDLTEKLRALLGEAQASQQSLKIVLEHLTKSDEISTNHEKRVEKLTEELQELIKRVESLLPGATSAGLASSFNRQRSRFEGPQRQWFYIFVICIGILVLVAIPSFVAAIGFHWGGQRADETWNAAWLSLVLRLPIVFPLVWLAIYAGRNYMMSLRMEEDYAYKEAISIAFEGYKREMEKIGVDEGDKPSPITILCTNILRAISERPGRIYEGKQQDINLLTEAQNVIEKSAEFSKKKVATQ
jgi:hypothetical protein